MKKPNRFSMNLFRSFREDPIRDDSIFGEPLSTIDFSRPVDESERIAGLASVFGSPYEQESSGDSSNLVLEDAAELELKRRDYVVNSIFAPPELREGAGAAIQQFRFVREQEGSLFGLEEINGLLRRGWRVSNVYATGNALYKALVLLERS